MLFSSLIFLFYYLPVVLLIYYITPRKYKNIFLFFANLIFYGWGEPIFIFIMLFSTVTEYFYGILIEKHRHHQKTARILLAASIVTNLSLLGFFKYAGFLAGLLNMIPFFGNIPVPLIPLPIGISFYTFQTMSYAIDVYRNDVSAERNMISFGTYITLFPQLLAGPIVRYKDIKDQLKSRYKNKDSRILTEQFATGVRLFIIGLSKKILIADQMGLLWNSLNVNPHENGLLGSWIGIIAFAMQIYFDFSGYSDMACGLGNMLGFNFLKNFNYPYMADSITDFWRRWHISLSTWFRDYVYIPLGGNRKGRFRTYLNLIAVWFLTGLWHGASWNFVLWGLYFCVILITEKIFLLKLLSLVPTVFRHLYAIVLILFGWIIFSFENISDMAAYLLSMFSLSGGLLKDKSVLGFLPLLFIACFACLPVTKHFYYKIKKHTAFPRFILLAELGVLAVSMLLCTSALVGQSYHPFLYFRF